MAEPVRGGFLTPRRVPYKKSGRIHDRFLLVLNTFLNSVLNSIYDIVQFDRFAHSAGGNEYSFRSVSNRQKMLLVVSC